MVAAAWDAGASGETEAVDGPGSSQLSSSADATSSSGFQCGLLLPVNSRITPTIPLPPMPMSATTRNVPRLSVFADALFVAS